MEQFCINSLFGLPEVLHKGRHRSRERRTVFLKRFSFFSRSIFEAPTNPNLNLIPAINPKPPNSLVMASSSSSGLTFKLHPLVIVNISDHYTRVKSQMNPTLAPSHGNNAAAPNGADGVVSTLPPRVYGCVIGVQKGRTVEIFNSFELLYDPSTHSLDRTFLEKKQELCLVFLSLSLSLSGSLPFKFFNFMLSLAQSFFLMVRVSTFLILLSIAIVVALFPQFHCTLS